MQNKYLLLTIICFIGTIKISAQPDVTSYSDLNDVYSLYFDDKAGTTDTMWIGSSGGVVYRVSTDFSISNTITQQDNGIGSNFITAIVVDDNGNKFFGSYDNGVTVYNSGSVTIYNSGSSPINDRIFCLAKDNLGHIWAGTADGAYRFNGTDWDSFNTDSEAPGEVRSLAVDGNIVWFGIFGGGIHSYDVVNLTWTHETQADGNIPSDDVTAIAARNDSLLVGTSGGISFFNPSGGGLWMTEIVGAAGNEIYDIIMWDFGTLYASTTNGLFSSGGSVWSLDAMLPYNPTGKIERVNYSIWIGFNEHRKGVLPYDFSTPPPTYTVIGTQYPNSNAISDIASLNNETFFSTLGAGLLIFDGTQWRVEEIPDVPGVFFYDMEAQPDTLWIAADNYGLAFYETVNGMDSRGISVSTASTISVAVDGRDSRRKWCGTNMGVFSFYDLIEDNTHRFTQGNSQLLNDIVISIAVDVNNLVWFLHENGATRYDEANTGNEFTIFSLSDLGLSSAQLNDIAADKNNGVWITSDNGIVFFDGSSATTYTTADGLNDNFVTSVFVDSRNIKYFGTNSGGINILSDFGWKNISKADGILTDHVTAIAFQEDQFQTNIWSAGDWGGISQTFIPPISVGAYTTPGNDLYCYGEPVTITADVTGGFGPGSYTLNWTTSDNSFTSTNPSETITPEYSLTYLLEANDGYNSGSSSIYIDVVIADTSVIVGPDTICPNGETVYYSPRNDAGTIKSYSWDISGGTINYSDPTNASIDVVWNTSGTNGSLFLTETDQNNCTVSQQFDVTIMEGLIPNIVLKNGGQILICIDSGYVYQWFRDEIPIPGATRQFYYLDADLGLINGIYHVEMNVGHDCIIKSNTQLIDRIPLKTYPVPAKNTVNIDFSHENNAPGKTVIRNSLGTIIEEISFTKEMRFKHLEIDVSNYQPGTYFYSIILGAERIESGKFIIN